MKRNIKSTSKTFNSQVSKITEIFHGYRHFNCEKKGSLEKLGYEVKKSNKHYKCYYNNKLVTTISSTPSDAYTGNQTIRQIRNFWEKYEGNNI